MEQRRRTAPHLGTLCLEVWKAKCACATQGRTSARKYIIGYVLFNFTFKAGLLRWRGYAFFSWCRSREQWNNKKDTAIPPGNRRVLKKGDFNTPSVFLLFEKKTAAWNCYFKTAVRLLYFVLAHEYPAAETTVFLLSRWADKITLLTKKEPTTTLINGLSALRLCVRLCDNENFKLYCID